MRILVLSHMFPWPGNPGKGIFVKQQAEEMLRQGLDVYIVAPRPWTPVVLRKLKRKWANFASIPRQRKEGHLAVESPPYLALPRIGYASAGKRMCLATMPLIKRMHIAQPFDIIHAHSALPDGQAALGIKKRLGIPVVVTIHGKDVNQSIYVNKACRDSLADVLDKADAVIAVSERVKRIVSKKFGATEKLTVINNGFDSEMFSPLEYNLSSEVVVSVSNLVASKCLEENISVLSKLVNKYPRLRYLIIGEGPERSRLMSLAQRLDVSDKVEFVGYVPNEQLSKHLSGAAFFSLPSKSEGFGIAFVEAMAAGLPVIARRGEGIEDVISHGVTGFLVRSSSELTNTWDKLLTNRVFAQKVGASAAHHVRNNYSWRANVRKLCHLYELIASRQRRSFCE